MSSPTPRPGPPDDPAVTRRTRDDFDEELRLIGRRLRTFRKNRGITQVQLTKLSGIQQKSISNIESGLLDFKIVTVMRLLESLGGSLNDVMHDDVSTL